jgi:uncharacterized protein
MNISLLRLPAAGHAFEHQYAADELDVSNHAFALSEPPHISGRIKQTGQDFHVTGEFKAAVVVSCDRCLRDLFIPVSEPFKLVYVPAAEARGRQGEHEVNEQELEFAYLDGDDLDIDQLIREQLELALPTRILCKEDCQGLCSQCGADLNESACQCEAPVDPRWQAIADLQKKNN